MYSTPKTRHSKNINTNARSILKYAINKKQYEIIQKSKETLKQKLHKIFKFFGDTYLSYDGTTTRNDRLLMKYLLEDSILFNSKKLDNVYVADTYEQIFNKNYKLPQYIPLNYNIYVFPFTILCDDIYHSIVCLLYTSPSPRD
jgi:hypothetical protein